MERFQESIANEVTGVPLAGIKFYVQNYPSGTAAVIYGVNDNTSTPLVQPLTTQADGTFPFYAANGHYMIVAYPPGGQPIIADFVLQDIIDLPSPQIDIGAQTAAAVPKTTPANADLFPLADSANGFGLKSFSWGNLVSIVQGWFSASSGSSLVGYRTSGAGAVATTVQAKLRESASVLDFGADNTGVANSTAAFNLASAATTQYINVPAGTYLLNTSPNVGMWDVDSGVTFTGAGVLTGKIARRYGQSSPFIQNIVSNFQTVTQLIGWNVEQGLYQTGTISALQFGQTTELFTPSASTTNFTGQLTSVYGSTSHFGSGTLTASFGGSFEAFNSGTASAATLVGVQGNAWNGGVNAGIPVQTATNNGNAVWLRGVEGYAANKSSGTVTAAAAFYANGITNTGGGVITTAYGMVISDQTVGVANYGLYTGLGINHFGDAINIIGRTNLPAATGTNLWIAIGTGSPSLGRIYVGDGGGWQLDFAKRTGGVDTILGSFKDSGQFITVGKINSTGPTSGIGYAAGAGGAITQITTRTTAVTINHVSGQITLFSAAGSVTPTTFRVVNSAVVATDTIVLNQGSGTDMYQTFVTQVAAGSFLITFFTTGGTTTEQPVFNFAVMKAVAD